MLLISHIAITAAVAKTVEKLKALQNIDYRWMLFGTILPDIIDKPIRWLFFNGSLFLGRWITEAICIMIMGYMVFRLARGKTQGHW